MTEIIFFILTPPLFPNKHNLIKKSIKIPK